MNVRRVRAIAVVTVIAAAVLALPRMLRTAGHLVGGYHDDGVYAVTARALAVDGRYEIASLPGPVAQTKYPVLFPAALAVIWKLFPSFPDNVAALRMVPWLCMWAWLYVVWLIAAVELGRREAAAWIVVLTLAAPATQFFGTQLMAETMFAFLASWAVLLLLRMHAADEPPTMRRLLLLTVVCALAFHTRTIAVTLFPAVAYVLLRRRGYRQLAAFAAGFTALAAPWIVWQAMHTAPADPVLAYYTKANYSAWNLVTGDGASAIGNVVGGNLVMMLALPAQYWAVPGSMFTAILSVALVILLLALALAALGGRAAPVSVWVLATVSITLVWMWPPERFLLPALPVALLLLVLPFQRAGAPAKWLGRVAAAALLVSALMYAATHGRRGEGTSGYLADARTESELAATLSWIRTQTAVDAVIAANLDPMVWLYTGRRAVRAFSADPYRLFYQAGDAGGALGGPDDLARLLDRHGVTHLVVEDLPLFSETRPLREQVARLREDVPDMLHAAWRSPQGMVTVYIVRGQGNALAPLDLRCTAG